ncbi:MAG TPA: RecX family transcriptional regulator [bacterium]|nr:RecX family transcriptional regulator [bacterium]
MDAELLRYFIRKKINDYLKQRPHTSGQLRHKLLLLPFKYPHHRYYPHYTPAAVDEVISQFVQNNLINDLEIAVQQCEFWMNRSWSNRKILEQLRHKLFLNDDILAECKTLLADREELEFTDKTKNQLKEKIARWQAKGLDKRAISQKLQAYLYQKSYTSESVQTIRKELLD